MPRKPPTKTSGWGRQRHYGTSRGLRLSQDLEEVIESFAAKHEVSYSEAIRRLVLDGINRHMEPEGDEWKGWREPLIERINRINQQTDNLQQRLDTIEGWVEEVAVSLRPPTPEMRY